MVVFQDTKTTVYRRQIEEIETLVRLRFPTEYSEHLLKYNGGRCEPNIFYFNERGRVTDSCVNRFLAIYEGEYDNLRSYIQILKLDDKRLPSHMIPIADDPGGNLICMSCGNKDYGSIYFWDHEREVNYNLSNDDDYSNLYLIAPSFNAFLDGLKEA